MTKLNGTVKQIAWATDIKSASIDSLNAIAAKSVKKIEKLTAVLASDSLSKKSRARRVERLASYKETLGMMRENISNLSELDDACKIIEFRDYLMDPFMFPYEDETGPLTLGNVYGRLRKGTF